MNFNPLSDTTRACGTSKVLDAGSGYSSYLWNTGATTQTIPATTGGFYKVTVTNAAGCSASDSTLLSLVNANIINNDTTICRGQSVTLCIDSLFPGRTACTAAGLPANLRNGLVGYWPFCGNANDASGNGNHATVVGAIASQDRFGIAAGSYFFEGSYLRMLNPGPLGTASRTVSFWAKSSPAYTGDGYIFSYGSNNFGGSEFGIRLLSICTNSLKLDVNLATNSNSVIPSPATSLWNFYTITYSSTDGAHVTDAKYYINGQPASLNCQSSTPAAHPINTLAEESITLGRWCDLQNTQGGGYYFNGDIDDVSVWSRVLSASEVFQLYQIAPTVNWSPGGATTNCITVSPTQTTRYYVTVTDGITTCTDSVLVTVSTVDTTLTLLDPPQVCATGGTVRMQAGVATGYQWLLNGSAIPGATSRSYSATATGTYRVALLNALGCRDTSRSVSISIAPQPAVGFTINAPGQCLSGNQFFFTNTSTIGNGTLTYLWSFGDGATATTTNATHSYAAPGTYQVKLVATSNSGCRDSAVNAVAVNPQPVARFTVTPTGQCLNTNLFQFTNSSTVSSGTFTSFWTFGDGNSSNATNPSHVYATAGTFSVKLVVTSNTGCRDSVIIPVTIYPKPIVSFSINTAAQCVNGNLFQFTNTSTITSGTLSYLWRFGDGGTATTTNASYSYAASGTFVVWLIATSNNGCKDSTSRVVTVNPKPNVSFTVNSPGQCVNGNQFIFTSTSTITSGTMSYFWTFGDGITANTAVANHTYLAAGTYTVKLVVTSNLNCRDSVSQTVTVYPKPSVGFTVNNPAQCLNGNNFLFTNTSTISSGTLTYIWDFGDGGSATSINAAYSYAAEGVYVVKLVAISNSGCRDSSTSVITVYPKPVVSFTVNASRQCQVGNLFQFANTSTIGNGTMIFSWDFGDGVTSTSQSTSHSYANPGTYVVKLRALSNNGCADSTSQTVTVDPSPVTVFTVNQSVQCFFGHQFSFLNNSSIASGSIQFLWDFGDGIGTSSVRNPVYTYAGPGTYTVTLTCVSNFNCSTQFSTQVIVRPTPTGTIFTAGSTVICEGSFITLSATGGDSYQWLLNGQPITGATSATYPATDAGTYSVILTNTFGCSATASNTITLTKVFQPTVDFSYDSYCVNLPVSFTNLTDTSRTGRVLYEWNFGDGGTSFIRNPTHVFRDSTTYAVRLAVTPLDCPNLGSSVTKSISFQPAPEPVRYPSINAVSGRNLDLAARLFTGASYVWQPGTGLSNATIRTPVFNATSAQQYLIKITTVAGCPVTDTLQVRMFSQRDIYVPDAFSPNGDGKNDRLMPLLVGITELKSFRVYDRWGQLLFQTNKVGDGWDGYFRGQKQPMETYTWIAEARDLDGNSLQKRGTSILLR